MHFSHTWPFSRITQILLQYKLLFNAGGFRSSHMYEQKTILFNRFRLLTEKASDQPEIHDEKEKTVEYSIPSWQVYKNLP